MNTYIKQRDLIWKMIHKYQLNGQEAFCAILLNKERGVLSAARFVWHVRKKVTS